GSAIPATAAGNIAAAISSLPGFHAVAEGATVAVTRTTSSADFKIVLRIDTPSQVTTDGAVAAYVVTLPALSSGDTYRLTVDGTAFTETTAGDLADDVNGTSGFTAFAAGSTLTIV